MKANSCWQHTITPLPDFPDAQQRRPCGTFSVSGDTAPSREDRDCTNRLVEASKILGIRVLDHIIFGEMDYSSFADAGLLT
jgi:hypothetical protein